MSSKNLAQRAKTTKPRWAALDDLRGIAVLCMIPVNVAAPFSAIPGWFKHAPATGLTFADFILPCFLFSLGLSASFSFSARVRERGFGRTLLHAFIRYAVLFAFGTAGILLVDHAARWEILQMLGATGIFSFFFMLLPPWVRLGAGAFMLACVEVLRPLGLGTLMAGWYDSGLAGPWGTFSLSFLIITASALGELIRDADARKRLTFSAAFGAAMIAAGIAASFFLPFSKHLVSLSYILFTGGISAGALALLVVITEMWRGSLGFVASLGRNPLILYMLHAVLGVIALAIAGAAAAGAAAWGASALVLLLCVAAALALDAKKLYIRL
ncbi:MAG: heparan-alpha-glucosaminide N-acetyltransferase domain-containing protein [Spirochaetia bacterium]|jgi:predicted acyltransferase